MTIFHLAPPDTPLLLLLVAFSVSLTAHSLPRGTLSRVLATDAAIGITFHVVIAFAQAISYASPDFGSRLMLAGGTIADYSPTFVAGTFPRLAGPPQIPTAEPCHSSSLPCLTLCSQEPNAFERGF